MEIVQNIKFFIVYLNSLFCFKKRSKVIFYHDIHNNIKYTNMSTSIKLFEKHIQVIRECGYEIVPEITNNYGQIEICFDDGFQGVYENLNFLKINKIPIHIFVISSFIGKHNYLNSKQLLELNKTGLIRISSHTHKHNSLSGLENNEIENELKLSKKIIEDTIMDPVVSLCYPNGRFSSEVIDIANSLGYRKQYSSLPGFYFNKFNKIVIRRSLVQFSNEKQFKAIISGGDHILFIWYLLKHFKI